MNHQVRSWTAIALSLVLALALVSCGTQEGTSQSRTQALSSDVTLYEKFGLTVAIPNALIDRLLIQTDLKGETTVDTNIICVYEKRSYEESQKDWGVGEEGGYLFSIVRYTRAQYEKFLASEGSGESFFAKDDTYYYGWFFPTDVQLYRSESQTLDTESQDWKEWEALMESGEGIKADFIERNGLTPYSDSEFWNKEFTYEGLHQYVSYYPYYTAQSTAEAEGFHWQDVAYTLVLSQPATQGDAGIWCVERWYDDVKEGNAYPYLYGCFPDSELPAEDYYAQRQAACDAGKESGLLDPLEVSRTFAVSNFGHTPMKESFRLLEGKPAGLNVAHLESGA